MRLSKKLFLTLIFILSLISCGGGGGGSTGGNSSPEPSMNSLYSGSLSQASINADNAVPLVVYTIEIIDLIEQFAVISAGDLFERIYFTLSENEDIGDIFNTSGEACEAGSIGESDNRNSEGIGDVTITFRDCLVGNESVNGIIKVDVSRNGNLLDIVVILDRLRLLSSSDNLDVILSGEIESTLESQFTFFESVPWTSSFLIEYVNSGIEVYARDLKRDGTKREDYQIQGDIFHSDFGGISLNLNTANSKIELSGISSKVVAQFTPGDINFDIPGQSIRDYMLTLDSDGDDTSEQTINPSVEQLVNYFTNPSTDPLFLVLGDSEIEKNMPLDLSLQIEGVGIDFYKSDWSLVSSEGGCQPELIVENFLRAYLKSGCSGEVTVDVTVSSARGSSTVQREIFVQRFLPDIEFNAPPGNIFEGQSFAVNVIENNPEEGPFEYGLAYGLPGSSVGVDGILSWDGSNIPRVDNPLEVNFGLSVANDRFVLDSFTTTLTFDNYLPPLISGLGLPVTNNHGAIDLEPENPNGDIAFFRSNSGTEIVKYNKAGNVFRSIASGMPRNLVPLSQFNENSRQLSYIDFNSDQILDLVSVRLDRRSGGGDDIYIVVYDLHNEVLLLDELLYSSRVSSTREGEVIDIHYVDIEGDGQKEFVYLLDGTRFLLDGSDSSPGVYSYTVGSLSPKLILKLPGDTNELDIYPNALIVHDLIGSSTFELLVATNGSFLKSEVYIFGLDQSGYAIERSLDFHVGGNDLDTMIDIMLQDIDGDGGTEIVAVYEDRPGSTSCSNESSVTSILVLDKELNVRKQHDLIGLKIRNVAGARDKSHGNIYITARDCTEGDEKPVFSYFNLNWGVEVWKMLIDANVWLPPRDAVTTFLDGSGNTKLAVGGLEEILVTQ